MFIRNRSASTVVVLAASLAAAVCAQQTSPPLAPGAVSAGSGNPYQRVTFTAQPLAVRPGEPVVLECSYGWMHTTVKPGDVITCTGGPARGGQSAMIASLIKLPDGRMIKS